MDYADSIKEGDGNRVLRFWKYLLPIFKASGRKNYSIEAVHLLNQVEFELTERECAELKWNRFVNVHGVQGRNIPCDLHMEHLNRVYKNAVYGLQANKTPEAIVHTGKSLGALMDILEEVNELVGVKVPSGAHHRPGIIKERDMILKILQEAAVFKQLRSRQHHSFPKVKVLLHSLSNEDLISWMIQHI